MAIDMRVMLAKAKANREAKQLAEQLAETTATAPAPSAPPLVQQAPAPVSAIQALRARLAARAAEETLAGHKAGTLPKGEEIVATVELAPQLAPQIVPHDINPNGALGMNGESITYNKEQQQFIDLASNGSSCVLIGSAGTGKTTCSKGGISALINAGKTLPLDTDGHRYLTGGAPGVIIISYTRRAVNNIRKVQSADMQSNCITSHKLLEYAPEYFELEDAETGATRKTMRFIPTRNCDNPLPSTISTIVVEEASMLSTELFGEIVESLQHEVQWIFIGDIQQLPPVFGSAVLGFKMLELPVVELKEVYRQALESPIIRLAVRVLSGKPIPVEEFPSWHVPDKLTIHPWKKKLSADNAVATLGAFFKAAIKSGVYQPNEDMILIPYNKACGTIEVNNHIADFLARQRDALTYEVMAGFNKHYFSVGDIILYDREDAEIVSIEPNIAYTGSSVQPASRTLDYWGHNPNLAAEQNPDNMGGLGGVDIDFLLDQVANQEDRVTQASHTMVIRLADTGSEITINKAAEINGLLLAYALTVHKSQGSEWRKVFFCLHQSHATMLQRELVYTGITRAREELYIICEPESLTKGIKNQKIKGNTLAEKAEFFKGKLAKR